MGYGMLDISSFSTLNMPFHCLLTSIVLDEKSAIDHTVCILHEMDHFCLSIFSVSQQFGYDVSRWVFLFLSCLQFVDLAYFRLMFFIKFGDFSAFIS